MLATDETLEQASLLSLWETPAAERQYGNTVTLTGLCAGCYDANERSRLTLFATAACCVQQKMLPRADMCRECPAEGTVMSEDGN